MMIKIKPLSIGILSLLLKPWSTPLGQRARQVRVGVLFSN